jgi:hypothetical protein
VLSISRAQYIGEAAPVAGFPIEYRIDQDPRRWETD